MKAEHAIAALFICTVLALGAACEISVWRECRAGGHSFIYCMRMVSK